MKGDPYGNNHFGHRKHHFERDLDRATGKELEEITMNRIALHTFVFCIVLPQKRSDLTTEGQSLNHCVGGQAYANNHMAGKRLIFFVRKISNRAKPFFTMEVDMTDFRICQLYGFGDCSAPEDVRKFAEAFVKKLAPARVARKTA